MISVATSPSRRISDFEINFNGPLFQ